MVDKIKTFWIHVLDRYGFPTVAVLALGWVIYESVSWTGIHIAQPVVDAHTRFLERQVSISETQEKLIEKIENAVAEHRKLVAENHTRMLASDSRVALDQQEIIKNQQQLISLIIAESKIHEKQLSAADHMVLRLEEIKQSSEEWRTLITKELLDRLRKNGKLEVAPKPGENP